MSVIRILSGSYRNQPVLNEVFTLTKGFQTGKKGNYVTVKNEGRFLVGGDEVRVKVDAISDIVYLNGEQMEVKSTSVPVVNTVAETEVEAMDRIALRFGILTEMSSACINGDIRALIVSGPPGVGKSHGVETQMEKASMFDSLAGNRPRFNVVKGAMTALGLYAQLYKYSDNKNVLIFDDCDSVFADELALNILKAALDSGKNRKICWNSDSRLLRDEGIPNEFKFSGSVIFITNIKFENVKSKKMQDHLEALQSRCHFLDLTIDSERDKMLRVKQVHRDADGGLFKDYDLTTELENEVLDFMWDNHSSLREVSLRMGLKIADLVKISPANWKTLARTTCTKG
jgi:hypothetical protein